MFCSHERLKKRTPISNGIDRKEYIGLLVDEYYETTDLEAKEQVTANLANFSYDPINYQHLKNASAIELFLELVSSPNPRLTLHGIAGLCNIIPDKESRDKILELDGLPQIVKLLKHPNDEIIQNTLAALIQFDDPDIRPQIFTSDTVTFTKTLQASKNPIIKNLATLLRSEPNSPSQ